MKYKKIIFGRFIARPNRFIAYVDVDGTQQVCHVKNTGRCKELLIPGANVFLEESDNPLRKTKYDLVSVFKGDMLVNMDSQAPNKVFGEWAQISKFFGEKATIKPECRYKNSRFDFYIESGERKIFVEVKGVTLENKGVVSFPDAPTQRGTKHLAELVDAVENGFEAYVFFIIQMEKCRYFEPNTAHDPVFSQALNNAQKNGVKICALNCTVTQDGLEAKDFVEVRI